MNRLGTIEEPEDDGDSGAEEEEEAEDEEEREEEEEEREEEEGQDEERDSDPVESDFDDAGTSYVSPIKLEDTRVSAASGEKRLVRDTVFLRRAQETTRPAITQPNHGPPSKLPVIVFKDLFP